MLQLLFSPSGRIGRGKWWLLQLINTVVLAISFSLLVAAEQPSNEYAAILLLLGSISLFLASIWSQICAMAKRYHDRNKSAWWILITFIPIVGSIWAFIELGMLAGTYGDNDYGVGPSMNIDDDLSELHAKYALSEPLSEASRVARPQSPSFQQVKQSYQADGAPPQFGKRV